ncbi:MAG: DUF4340 domain-containing protein [Ruminococcus sp.]|nr:DUF4340 domain-containing protein [Ruminococcus sp.]
MNGKLQGIIVCGVVAASLAGVMVFLSATEKKDKDTSSSQAKINSVKEDESVIILEKDSTQVNSVEVVNEYGEFTVAKPASGKMTWAVDKLEGINQNSTRKEGMITITGELEAKKLVEQGAEDLSKYGLDKPAAQFTVNYSDHSSQTVLIGDQAPESRYYYVKLDSSNDVYMVLDTKLNYFTEPYTDYAELALIAKPSQETWPEYGTETVTRTDWDYEVTFENDPNNIEGMLSSQVISSPIFAYLNIQGSSDVTHGMWGLTAAQCYAVKPDDAKLKECGLDEPRCTVHLEGEGYDYLLKIGSEAFAESEEEDAAPEKLGYYCYLEGVSGVDAVYIIAESNLPWVTFKIEDVITSIMTSNYLVDLTEISIDVGGDKTVYEIESNGTSKDKFDDGSVADVTSVKCNGKDLDVDNFKSLYQYIMTCPTDEICFTDPESPCELTIVEKRYDGGSDTIELFKDTERRYIVKLNGRTSFRIQSTWIDTLLKNMDNIKNGVKIDDNY